MKDIIENHIKFENLNIPIDTLENLKETCKKANLTVEQLINGISTGKLKLDYTTAPISRPYTMASNNSYSAHRTETRTCTETRTRTDIVQTSTVHIVNTRTRYVEFVKQIASVAVKN
eukprot:Pgem_evm1s8565